MAAMPWRQGWRARQAAVPLRVLLGPAKCQTTSQKPGQLDDDFSALHTTAELILKPPPPFYHATKALSPGGPFPIQG